MNKKKNDSSRINPFIIILYIFIIAWVIGLLGLAAGALAGYLLGKKEEENTVKTNADIYNTDVRDEDKVLKNENLYCPITDGIKKKK